MGIRRTARTGRIEKIGEQKLLILCKRGKQCNNKKEGRVRRQKGVHRSYRMEQEKNRKKEDNIPS